jgi:hypothetical protein
MVIKIYRSGNYVLAFDNTTNAQLFRVLSRNILATNFTGQVRIMHLLTGQVFATENFGDYIKQDNTAYGANITDTITALNAMLEFNAGTGTGGSGGSGAGGSANWGNIGGVLANQTDLVTALSGKANASHTHAKSEVGLGDVPNLDTSNPINIAQNSTHRFVSDAEKATWNASQQASASFTQQTNGDYLSPTFVANIPIVFLGANYPQTAIANQMRWYDKWEQIRPNAPTTLATTAVLSTSADLTWVAPTFRNKAQAFVAHTNILYSVEYRVVGAPSWTVFAQVATLTAQLTGLTATVNYQVRVRALFDYDLGETMSDDSNIISFTTPAVPTRWALINAFSGATRTFRQNNTAGYAVTDGQARAGQEFTYSPALETGGLAGNVDFTIIADIQVTAGTKVNGQSLVTLRNSANNTPAFRLLTNGGNPNTLNIDIRDGANAQIISVTAFTPNLFDGNRKFIIIEKRGVNVSVWVGNRGGSAIYNQNMSANTSITDRIQIGHRTDLAGTVTANSFGSGIFGVAVFIAGTQPTTTNLIDWFNAPVS